MADMDELLLQLVLDGLEGLDALLLGLVRRAEINGFSGCLAVVSLEFPGTLSPWAYHCQCCS